MTFWDLTYAVRTCVRACMRVCVCVCVPRVMDNIYKMIPIVSILAREWKDISCVVNYNHVSTIIIIAL